MALLHFRRNVLNPAVVCYTSLPADASSCVAAVQNTAPVWLMAPSSYWDKNSDEDP
jgi:hypothetical protein